MKDNTKNLMAGLALQSQGTLLLFNRVELLFYIILIFNCLYTQFYPVYLALYDYYSRIIISFIALMFIFARQVRVNKGYTVAVGVFLLFSLGVILVNHTGLGVLLYFVWSLAIIYFLKGMKFSSDYITRLSKIMIVIWGIAVFMISVSCLFIELYISKRSKSKLTRILLYVVSLCALLRTRARTPLVAFICVLSIGFLFKNAIKHSKKIALVLLISVIVMGIVFPFLYVYMFEHMNISYDTVILGKRLFTGRQYIWQNVMTYVQNHKETYLWGTGYNATFYSRGTFNLHNSYWGIFAIFGIPVLLICLWYLIHSVSTMYSKRGYISDLQFVCYQIIMLFLIISFGETIMINLSCLIYLAMAIGIGCRERERGVVG